jgi:hypothetical protein
VGGPAPQSPASPHLEPGGVIAGDEGGIEQGATNFREGLEFSLSLPPGTYRLVATSTNAQCLSRKVTVEPGRYEAVKIRCSIK